MDVIATHSLTEMLLLVLLILQCGISGSCCGVVDSFLMLQAMLMPLLLLIDASVVALASIADAAADAADAADAKASSGTSCGDYV